MRFRLALLCLVATCALETSVVAADFYAGKTISLSTHSDPGSGYDSYLRLLARYYGRHIAGSPNFVILNMTGGGGLTAINHAGRIAPKDGTFLTLVSQGLLVIQATSGKGLQVSLGDFKWLGNFSQTNDVTVSWHKSPVKTPRDAQERETLVGATGAGSATVVGPTLYNALVGTRFKIIQGYTGSGAVNLAMQRSELDGHANSTWSSTREAII